MPGDLGANKQPLPENFASDPGVTRRDNGDDEDVTMEAAQNNFKSLNIDPDKFYGQQS